MKICAFFDADSFFWARLDAASSGYILRQCDRANPERAFQSEMIDNEHSLIRLAADSDSICYQKRNIKRKILSKINRENQTGNAEVLADLLNANSFISVPLYQRENIFGRTYMTSKTKNFSSADAEFLRQIVEHAAPVVDNVFLLDKLASEATEQQRLRISRDIHDSTVQPYIGLKLGLEALEMKHTANENIAADIRRLIYAADENISGIRSYITNLKDGKADTNGAVLVFAIRQHAKKLSEFYGINVEVSAEKDISVSDRLSAEVFQIVAEGLSNMRRHTKTNHALIAIECKDDKLKLEISNDNSEGGDLTEFVPKSIAGRAAALGGRASVRMENNLTIVSIEIPI